MSKESMTSKREWKQRAKSAEKRLAEVIVLLDDSRTQNANLAVKLAQAQPDPPPWPTAPSSKTPARSGK